MRHTTDDGTEGGSGRIFARAISGLPALQVLRVLAWVVGMMRRAGVSAIRDLEDLLEAGLRLAATASTERLGQAVANYNRIFRSRGRRDRTVERNQFVLGSLVAFAGADLSVVRVTAALLARWLLGQQINMEIARQRLGIVSRFFRWWAQSVAAGGTAVPYDPTTQVDLLDPRFAAMAARRPAWGCRRIQKRRAKGRRILTPDELRRLAWVTLHYRPDLIPFLALQLYCGLRPESESIPDWRDVDLDKMRVTIRDSKTGQIRPCQIPRWALPWLLPHRRPSGPITHIDYVSWKRVRPKLLRRARVRGGHDILRATCASVMVALSGGDLKAVADGLGHSVAVLLAFYFCGIHRTQRKRMPRRMAIRYLRIAPPEGWEPNPAYRPRRVRWEFVPLDSLMLRRPSFRQGRDFLRGGPRGHGRKL